MACCPSTYTTDKGCCIFTCTTEQQRKFIGEQRGNNKNFPEYYIFNHLIRSYSKNILDSYF